MAHSTPTATELLACLLGEADEATRVRVLEQRDRSPQVRAAWDRLEAMLADLPDHAALAALFEVDAAAIDRIAAASLPGPGLLDRARQAARHIASMISDSGLTGLTPAAGFRGASAGRRLVFGIDEIRIDVKVSQKRPAIAGVTAGEVEVAGQVTGMPEAEALTLTSADSQPSVWGIDDDGFFCIVIAPGRYRLDLEAGETIVSIEEAELTLES